MKKIIIVNNNMKVGGVQKSLYNLLWEMQGRYEITLLLFCPVGAYMDRLPPSVKVETCTGLFRYLGVSQGECTGADALKRGVLAALCRAFGRPAVMKLLLAGQKTLPDTYDCAISFLHDGNRKSFYGGTQDFVLHRIRAKRKIAFLHCDYRSCGADFEENNRSMARFDAVAACSDGCGHAFRQVLPGLGDKCVTVRNCHRFDEIRTLAQQEPVCYDSGRVNVVMVTRLAHEKGIERAIEAAAVALNSGIPIALHIVGGGGMLEKLRTLVRQRDLDDVIFFYGEQQNPYRFLINADLFLLTSYHEAAPMVIEEARFLGIPVLTVETTSSGEMVTREHCGWVCENSQQALNDSLTAVVKDREALHQMKKGLILQSMDNTRAAAQFAALIEE